MPPKKYMRKPRRAKRTRSVRPKTTVSKSIKRYVKSTIHANIENKIENFTEDFSFSSINANGILWVAPLLPTSSSVAGIQIPQTVGQGGRTGNQVRTRKLIFRYVLTPQAYDATFVPQPQPCMVRMYFGYIRGCRTIAPDATQLSNFFQAGSSTEPFGGNLTDMIRPYNRDLFHVCCMRTHKIGNAVIFAATANPAADQQFSNNDYALNAMGSIDLTKYVPKTLKFNDATNTPDTGLFVWFNSVYADGNLTVDNAAQTRCFYSIDYEYEDA